MKIGIIGRGNVGTALGNGPKQKGHQIRFGYHDPCESVEDAARFGEMIILAVPFTAVKDPAQTISASSDGKVAHRFHQCPGPGIWVLR
jgi:predicted dinucleotide-binding enzyme